MSKKNKIYTVVSTIIFILIYFGIKHYREGSDYKEAILGEWESNEANGGNFSFTFLRNNTVEISNGDTILKIEYQINQSKLKLIENEKVKKDYLYKIESEKLILSEKGDDLIFRKVD